MNQPPTREPTTRQYVHGVVAVLVVAAILVVLLAAVWFLIYGPCGIWACAA
jgi:phosphotransferase system  glucose/maltose/N-acetylglucosamine-specific IIC component